MAKGTGQLVRIVSVTGGAVGERILVSLAPASYHMMADGAAVLGGGAGAMYLKPGLMQDVSIGVCAGGAIGLVGRFVAQMRAPTAAPAIEAGGGGPALSAAVYDRGTGTYGAGSALPAKYRVISRR